MFNGAPGRWVTAKFLSKPRLPGSSGSIPSANLGNLMVITYVSDEDLGLLAFECQCFDTHPCWSRLTLLFGDSQVHLDQSLEEQGQRHGAVDQKIGTWWLEAYVLVIIYTFPSESLRSMRHNHRCMDRWYPPLLTIVDIRWPWSAEKCIIIPSLSSTVIVHRYWLRPQPVALPIHRCSRCKSWLASDQPPHPLGTPTCGMVMLRPARINRRKWMAAIGIPYLHLFTWLIPKPLQIWSTADIFPSQTDALSFHAMTG